MKSLRYVLASMVLVVCMIMNLMIPTLALPERGVIVDVLHEYVNNGARGVKPPTESINLSNNDYGLSGHFVYRTYTNKKFMPDGKGELKYDIKIDYRVEGEDYHLQKGLKVEVYKKTSIFKDDELVSSVQYLADKVPGQDYIYEKYIEGTKTVKGLDPNAYYYILLIKADDGIDADISGTISHP